MSEKNKTGRSRLRRIRHTGRLDQVFIYLGKQLRFFINQSDWKVLPMAAIIAGLVGMVIRRRFFVNMEGSLIGAFALTCVALSADRQAGAPLGHAYLRLRHGAYDLSVHAVRRPDGADHVRPPPAVRADPA